MEYNPKIRFKFIENLWQERDHREPELALKAIYKGEQLPHSFTEVMFYKSLKSYKMLYEDGHDLSVELIAKIFRIWSEYELEQPSLEILHNIIKIIKNKLSLDLERNQTFIEIFTKIIKNNVFPKFNIEMAKLISNYVFIFNNQPPIIMYCYGTMHIVNLIETEVSFEDINKGLMFLINRTKKFNEVHNEVSLSEIKDKIYDNMLILKEEYGVKNIFIYGSYARGEQNKYSDIDLFVHLYDEKKIFANIKNILKNYLTSLLELEVDLIVDDLNYDKNQIPVDIFDEIIKVF